jgi:hypothetical protein
MGARSARCDACSARLRSRGTLQRSSSIRCRCVPERAAGHHFHSPSPPWFGTGIHVGPSQISLPDACLGHHGKRSQVPLAASRQPTASSCIFSERMLAPDQQLRSTSTSASACTFLASVTVLAANPRRCCFYFCGVWRAQFAGPDSDGAARLSRRLACQRCRQGSAQHPPCRAQHRRRTAVGTWSASVRPGRRHRST